MKREIGDDTEVLQCVKIANVVKCVNEVWGVLDPQAE